MNLNKDNFSKFFNEKLHSKLVILEKNRTTSLNQFLLFSSIYIIIVVLIGIKLFFINQFLALISLLALVFGLPFIFNHSFKDYIKNFKERILHILFKEIFDEFEHDRKGFISQEEFKSSLLYRKQFNRYSGEDLINGTYKGHDIKLSELQVTRVKKVDSVDSNGSHSTKEETTQIFDGLMILLKIKTPYHSATVVEPDSIIDQLSFIEELNIENINVKLEPVHLESIEFEKVFSVRSTNQIESRKILKPAVQENLTEFRTKYNMVFAFSIQPNLISIAIPTSTNFFEPPIFSSCLKVSSIKETVEIFLFLEELLNEIHKD